MSDGNNDDRMVRVLEELKAQLQAGQTLGLSERELGALIALPSAVMALTTALEAEQSARAVLKESVDHNSKILAGNGDPSKGLILRFDRQEQTMATLTKVIYALSMGLGLALIKAAIDLVTG